MFLTLFVIFAAILSVLFLMPIRLQADLYHGDRTAARILLMAAGLRKQWHFALVNGPQGRQLAQVAPSGEIRPVTPSGLPAQISKKVLRRLRMSPRPRRFLLTHIRPIALQGLVRIHAANAAHSALLTGFVRSLLPLLPSRWRQTAKLHVIPDFIGEPSSLQLRCIIRFRAGTLLITMAMLSAEYLWRQIVQTREAA